jgi:hypothetical protein
MRESSFLPPSGVPRARRYQIGTVIRYRAAGERDWREGILENISTSGVLFGAERALFANTMIEMSLCLPIELNGESAAEVFCRGSVVRSCDCAGSDRWVRIAVRLEHSRFLRAMSNKGIAVATR